jgi:hypothetical protein
MTAGEIIQAIAAGEADGQLEAVFQAYRARHRYLRQTAAITNQAELTAGTRVLISGSIKPKYLAGVRGTVAPSDPMAKAGSILVDIDADQYTGRYPKHLRVPANCLVRAAA